MRPSSTINSSLAKKRRKNFLKKIVLLSVFVLVVVSVTLFGITSDKLKVKNIIINGNVTVSRDQILADANVSLNKKYLWFIPTDNFFLLRRSLIEKTILTNMKKIESVKVTFSDTHTVQITVSERQQYALWCASASDCYSMDHYGFIYEQTSPATTSAKYFGLITDTPIGKTYFEPVKNTASVSGTLVQNDFKNISTLFTILTKLNLQPESFTALDEHEYEVKLSLGGTIFLNDKKTLEKSLTNLQALIDGGYIKTDEAFLKKIKYIDLRYGNKVDFKLN